MRWILFIVLLLSAPVHSGEATALPPGGRLLTSILPTFHGAAERASCATVAVDGMPFAQALRIDVLQPGKHNDVEAKVAVPAALAKGETLLLRLWLRAVQTRAETGEVALRAQLQKSPPDRLYSFRQGVSAGRDWREVLLPFTIDHDFPAAGAELAFHLADREQVLELGGVELWSFGTALMPSQLPRLRITWAGMEPDAPWRAEAEARIERLRKGDLAVRVVDAAGAPLAGAEVRVRQLRHAFPFGTAATAARIMGATAEDETYRRHLGELFNAVVLENDLKWPAWVGEWDSFSREQTLAALRWLKQHRFLVRGHVLVWPSQRNMPKMAAALMDDPVALRQAIRARIDDAAAATAGLVAHWDVLNEPFNNHDVMDSCGREVMVEWFERARERLPADCRLFINDFGIVAAGGATDTLHQRHYAETIRYLLDQGAPLEGIGVQSHFGQLPTPPVTALAILDRFAAFKLPILVTEFDVDTQDEDYQAAYTRDYLTLCFSHPAVAGFLMWGFWEGRHWKPQAAMLRQDWTAKPNLAVWRELVLQRWWTDLMVKTGADGVARVRGFKGAYTVEAVGRTAAAVIGEQPADLTLGR